PVFGWTAWKMRKPVPHSAHFTISRWKFSFSLIVARQKQRTRSPTISCAPTSDFAIWRNRSLAARAAALPGAAGAGGLPTVLGAGAGAAFAVVIVLGGGTAVFGAGAGAFAVFFVTGAATRGRSTSTPGPPVFDFL